jgi:hypothetical protein
VLSLQPNFVATIKSFEIWHRRELSNRQYASAEISTVFVIAWQRLTAAEYWQRAALAVAKS